MNLTIWILPDVIGVLCVLIALVLTRWLRRQVQAVKTHEPSPIEDSIAWKRRRRLADARQWQEQWDRILPAAATPTPTNIPARQTSELRALAAGYITHNQARTFYRGGWDGRHHATCPYECDCPEQERRPV